MGYEYEGNFNFSIRQLAECRNSYKYGRIRDTNRPFLQIPCASGFLIQVLNLHFLPSMEITMSKPIVQQLACIMVVDS